MGVHKWEADAQDQTDFQWWVERVKRHGAVLTHLTTPSRTHAIHSKSVIGLTGGKQ